MAGEKDRCPCDYGLRDDCPVHRPDPEGDRQRAALRERLAELTAELTAKDRPAGEPMTLRDWQRRVARWHRNRHPHHGALLKALKLAEEAGEACAAVLKVAEGHPRAAEMDLGGELADVLIVVLTLADHEGLDMAELLAAKFEEVVARG